ncbi:hypothetical protein CK203_069441 [Vitis vinifera]|uniref:Uncharacterized protein n=1 Tax=Vitis vinifera TaxID=29760 RepID=A0A438C0R3_VITVI|nr:hypothetical protein CK203_069441 [Vitis vinifera]
MEDGDPHGGAQDDFIFDDDDLNGIILLELQELRRLNEDEKIVNFAEEKDGEGFKCDNGNDDDDFVDLEDN